MSVCVHMGKGKGVLSSNSLYQDDRAMKAGRRDRGGRGVGTGRIGN